MSLDTLHFTLCTLHFALLISFSKHKKQYNTWRTYASKVRRKYETKMESPAWENRKYILRKKKTYCIVLYNLVHVTRHFTLCTLHFTLWLLLLLFSFFSCQEIIIDNQSNTMPSVTYAIQVQRKYETKMESPAWEKRKYIFIFWEKRKHIV